MAKCVTKRIPKIKICISDLRRKIDIQTRAIDANMPGQYNPSEAFATISSTWAAVETPNGRSKFLGVNINESTTHVFIVRYHAAIAGLEVANNFILFDSKRMRILNTVNMNEDNIFIAIECSERGDDTKDATEA